MSPQLAHLVTFTPSFYNSSASLAWAFSVFEQFDSSSLVKCNIVCSHIRIPKTSRSLFFSSARLIVWWADRAVADTRPISWLEAVPA